ncbi:sensor histidine kinase [Mycobacterium tuberculosis]|uniref:ATP-binding protein n=1 Tax=Mycobacterium tuberculosis TaxID=1773 RepID=UPI0011B97BBA|nr:ATP-binding protein [Mycobacterium tuberculosis]TXB88402.1 sensor histidine kinase [Mycobacterium tuberculosis]
MPITPLLHESVARFAATGADITTRAEPDLFVSIDPDHLRRILTAVLDNAITHGDGEIAVTAHARDGAVDIGVRDHGPGFADHFLPVAFDRFTRADTARGGHANATNHPDGGAELRITLPTPRPPFHEELPRITSSDTKDPNREHDTSDQ